VSGGARSRSGPAPDPNALRRDRDQSTWLHLPSAGRQGEAPAWPLVRPTRRELVLWEREWRRPQAIIWERHGQELLVALYVRSVVAAEKAKAPTYARKLVQQLMLDLGITEEGLLRHRWIIDDEDSPVAEVRPTGTEAPSARARLKLVSPGG
jgi:hypothetical protein